tara:strand:+ start:7668 stop:8063 length:396 start_codon:yes stop_codon:yes gene_type:complete
VSKTTTRKKATSNTTRRKKEVTRSPLVIAVENHLKSLTPQQLIQYGLPAIQDMAIPNPIPMFAETPEAGASKIYNEMFVGSMMRVPYVAVALELERMSMTRGDERLVAAQVSRLATVSVFMREAMERHVDS